MSKLRDKARKIRDAGAEERKNFQPEEGSVPLRMYSYWLNLTYSPPYGRENFCHYWRGVLIWAPLYWLGTKISTVTGTIISILLYLGLAFTLGQIFDSELLTILLLGIPWLVTGVVLGVAAGLGNAPAKWQTILLGFFTLPVLGTAYLLTQLAIKLDDKLPIGWDDLILGVILGAIGILMTGLVGILFVTWYQSQGLIHLLIQLILGILALAVLALAAGTALYLVETFVIERRKRAKTARAARIAKAIEAGETIPPSKTSKLRRAVSKFFAGVGDIVIFLGQVIRVKKWKICPLVEIPELDRRHAED